MKLLNIYLPIIILSCMLLQKEQATAQDFSYPYEEYKYRYILYEKNEINIPGQAPNLQLLWNKFDKLIKEGKGQVNIIHFGGSHIQAGIYSGQTRKRLQNFFPGLNAGRGMIFPYRINHSNSPSSYRFHTSGSWTACDNVGRGACYPGLLGIKAYSSDSLSGLQCTFNPDYGTYDFNTLKVFHKIDSNSYTLSFPDSCGEYSIQEFPDYDYSLVKFENYQQELSLNLKKTNESQNGFTLYGISFETDDPGIIYHDTGINGASLPSFNKCLRLKNQMAALSPDLVIISLGTNDTYTRNFKSKYYKANYTELIEKIKNVAPNAAILMTVPNDSYYRRRYPNKNTAAAEKVILETAKEQQCGVWNLYKIMGGLNSSSLWYKDRLMVYDRIHFTPKGYLIKGNLLFFALMKSYDEHIEAMVNPSEQ
ncbi:MAG: GDSL-type esterase/lipase family protein [Bacteroidota bacterium]|nr:GDSL-type esterase/lipase family protein [Bacteroidota bacterium]